MRPWGVYLSMEATLTQLPSADALLHGILADEAPALTALAIRMMGDASEAQDVLQEAWIRAWRHREALRDPVARRGWLRRIVVRESLRALRWRSVRRWLPFGEDVPEVPVIDDPAHAHDVLALRRAVERLSAQQRLVFGLRFDEGWTLPEIAEATGLSTETIKTHLTRALARVRLELDHV